MCLANCLTPFSRLSTSLNYFNCSKYLEAASRIAALVLGLSIWLPVSSLVRLVLYVLCCLLRNYRSDLPIAHPTTRTAIDYPSGLRPIWTASSSLLPHLVNFFSRLSSTSPLVPVASAPSPARVSRRASPGLVSSPRALCLPYIYPFLSAYSSLV